MERKVIEWVPRVWWVVDSRPTGYTPLYKGTGTNPKADAERWLRDNPDNSALDNGLTPD